MERQVALVLVALCTLLGCAYTCEFTERMRTAVGEQALPSALEKFSPSDPDTCRARCCGHAHCDTYVLELRQDAPAQCFLLECKGACVTREDVSGNYRVFTRNDAPAQEERPHVEPYNLSPETRTAEPATDICSQKAEVGMCKASLPRFFFNSSSGSCEEFIYGGCGGNKNNFDSQAQCEAACPGVKAADEGESSQIKARMAPPLEKDVSEDDPETQETKEVTQEEFAELCLAPPVVGMCRGYFPRWFYNSTSGKCEKFVYGGCRGNKNNYEDEAACSSSCSGVKVQASEKQVTVMSEKNDAHCAVAPEAGPCRAAFRLFFFDPDSQSCKTFIYGGCRGNENRYGTEQECLDMCVTTGETFERNGRNHWTAAFFLFLALAAISFLLLTALVFVTVKRNRNRPARSLSVRSDKVGLLPDSEVSSVDSLPLPESPDKA
ncbi:hypothetical protein WMY93_030611 [Mugilogobius chulae]|uniref:BPTI/Kunitz inhibitor domain-containing protein n=1 Tax=Mugilogobius chulae TaxID=88201 RepID=A0AAW0MSG3_9GOBI